MSSNCGNSVHQLLIRSCWHLSFANNLQDGSRCHSDHFYLSTFYLSNPLQSTDSWNHTTKIHSSVACTNPAYCVHVDTNSSGAIVHHFGIYNTPKECVSGRLVRPLTTTAQQASRQDLHNAKHANVSEVIVMAQFWCWNVGRRSLAVATANRVKHLKPLNIKRPPSFNLLPLGSLVNGQQTEGHWRGIWGSNRVDSMWQTFHALSKLTTWRYGIGACTSYHWQTPLTPVQPPSKCHFPTYQA